MKVEVTQKGVYDAKGSAIPVGTELTVKGDAVPAWLVNKCRVLVERPAKEAKAVTNPAGDDTQSGGAA